MYSINKYIHLYLVSFTIEIHAYMYYNKTIERR